MMSGLKRSFQNRRQGTGKENTVYDFAAHEKMKPLGKRNAPSGRNADKPHSFRTAHFAKA